MEAKVIEIDRRTLLVCMPVLKIFWLTLLVVLFTEMRRIQLGDLPQQTYESLKKEVLLLAGPSVDDAGNNVTLTYEDVDKHSVKIGSTRELVYAVQDCSEAGFVVIAASIQSASKFASGAPTASPAAALAAGPTVSPPAAAPVTPIKIEGQCSQSRKRKAPAPSLAGSKRSTGGRKKKPSQKKLEADEAVEAAMASMPEVLAEADSSSGAETTAPDAVASTPAVVVRAPPKNKKSSKAAGVRSVQDKITDSLMELRALQIMEPPRIQVALFAGYSNMKSAGFVKACSQLKKQGIIEYPTKKTIQCSEAGAKKLPAVDPPVDNAAVQARLRVILKGKSKGKIVSTKTDQLFEVLNDGKVYARQAVADALGYTNLKSAGFVKALSTLSALGLAIYPDKTTVQLTDIAFLYGRPGNVGAS